MGKLSGRGISLTGGIIVSPWIPVGGFEVENANRGTCEQLNVCGKALRISGWV